MTTIVPMYDDPQCFDTFEGPARSIAVDVGGVKVRSSRAAYAATGITMSSEPADAIGLIYQVSDSASHDLWLSGRYRRVGPVSAGTMQILELDQAGHSRHDGQFDSVNIHIPIDALRRLGPTCEDSRIVRPAMKADWSTRDPFISSMLPALLWMLEKDSLPDRLVTEHLFGALLLHVLTAYGAVQGGGPAQPGGLTPRQLARVKQLLGDDLTRDVSLAELARECNLSPSYVSRTFKAATGMSPFAWRAHVRVDAGKALLKEGGATMAEVAARCGFADRSHFTRTFQRLVGDPPKRWQRKFGRT